MLSSRPAGTPAKVLIVDDSPANLLALEVTLQELGAELVRAQSGSEALARTLADDFAAVLLDVHMPDIDGFETARMIRSRARSRSTPILFITASDSADPYLDEAYALGAVDFLTKPLRPSVLKGKVAFFIELHRHREDLRQAERRAVNERAFLTAVLEGVQDAIVACDADGTPTLFNRATRELHDQAAQAGAAPPACSQLPEHQPLMRALAGEHVRQAEIRVGTGEARERILLASAQPLYDGAAGAILGAVVSMHDVTAERQAAIANELAVREQARREAAEQAADRLRASDERYRRLFDTMDEGFCVIELIFDEEGRAQDFIYLEANPTFYRHTELHEVVGRRMRELVPKPNLQWLEVYAQVSRSGQPQRLLHEVPELERCFDVSITPVGGPATRRVALMSSEVTERVRAEAQLRRVARELTESDRRKTEFLATLAHELRNPLAPLRNGLHLLRQVNDADARGRTWDMMDRQLSHMVRLIDDLLDIARVSTGKMEMKKRQVELRRLVHHALEASHPQIEKAQHTLTVQLPPEQVWLEVDPTRIEQVLANLLSNAAKYTPAHGHIQLGARVSGDELVIWVRDDGIGMDSRDLPRVFQMFTQVMPDDQRMASGLGIGLALVQAIVELHRGRIHAESPGPGLGSTFTVTLPLAAARSGTGTRERDANAGETGPAGFQVLVVDDNVDAAESLALILQMDGHATRVAHDGARALELTQEFDPQVVFLDIGMPGMDGYEVARAMRRQQHASRQPVLVALTGWGSHEDLERARSAGFDHHLTKPADVEAVERLLAALKTEA